MGRNIRKVKFCEKKDCENSESLPEIFRSVALRETRMRIRPAPSSSCCTRESATGRRDSLLAKFSAKTETIWERA